MGANKKRKLTKSESLELTKTLVLNFNELEQIANYEKKTSKKPAITVAIIGLFAIMSGLLYSPVNNLLSKKNNTHQYRVSKEIKYKKVVCTKTSQSLENTTVKNTIIFKLKKDSLISYENDYVEKINSTSIPQTPQGILNIYNYMTPLVNLNIPGYELKQTYTTSETNPQLVTSLNLKLNVDLEKLDITKLTEAHIANGYLNVIYNKGENSTNIKQKLMTEGYTCD